MLILRRKEGQWVELTHKSGDTIRLRVYNIRSRYPGQLDIAFDDDARNFVINRPERAVTTHESESDQAALDSRTAGAGDTILAIDESDGPSGTNEVAATPG